MLSLSLSLHFSLFLSPHSFYLGVFPLVCLPFPPPASFDMCVFDMRRVCGQMTAGRCHTLLSPVTEESGEEGTNSEVSSPPACRSPSPGANADAPLNQVLQSPPALPDPTRVCSTTIHFTFFSPEISFSAIVTFNLCSNLSVLMSHQLNIES